MLIGLTQECADLYRRLLIADTQLHLPNTDPLSRSLIPNADLARLLSVASILSLSSEASERTSAYEIATRIVSLGQDIAPELLKGSEFILARLGNFPGRQLLRSRYPTTLGTSGLSSPYLHLEVITREVENTVEDAAGHLIALTDFQCNTLTAFSASKSVSVSAPTSAGKSFVLSLEVIRKLRERSHSCIVYLVPTRALIRQVVLSLRDDLRKANLAAVPVRSIPTPVEQASVPQGIIYVLTQERLLSLLHSGEADVWITTLIVDEAQGVGDGSRGILLHAAIDEVVERFPKSDVFFASPLSRNPEYLLAIYHLNNGIPTIEQHSPVSQNLIFLEPVNGDSNATDFQLYIEGETLSLGQRELGFSLRNESILLRRAKVAVAVVAEGASGIVYANGARDAERIAEAIANQLPPSQEIDSQIQEFISFLEQYIHPNYGLIEVLRKGVAFHYSNMPGSVRAGVEDLCRANKLKFICCTSTLLQGVNLPARDIIIENPHRGRGKPMKRGDFVNLVGRAGRLLKEFHGNVWCLRPYVWDESSYVGEPLQEIKSTFHECLVDGGTIIRQVLDEDRQIEERERDTAITALNHVFSKYTLSGSSILSTEYRTVENEQSLMETEEKLASIEHQLPNSVFRNNYGILPTRLESLFEVLSSQDDPREWIPIAPYVKGNLSRLREILRLTERELQRDNTRRYEYFTRIAFLWIHQNHVRQILSDRLNYLHRQPEEVNERNVIYQTIEDLEKVIRFRFSKHLRAYNDVLSIALRDKGFEKEADSLVPLHLYMECGAAHPATLSLISLGLSRVSAILLSQRIIFPRDSNPEDCIRIISNINLDKLKLPQFCYRETMEVISGRAE